MRAPPATLLGLAVSEMHWVPIKVAAVFNRATLWDLGGNQWLLDLLSPFYDSVQPGRPL